MLAPRRSAERGHGFHGWLDTRHSFSFADYHDPRHMGFRSLRVINEDVVAPARGFGEHPHRDMEIVTYVLSGSLQHRDSTGQSSVIRPGRVQRMTAGRGVTHSEVNPSPDEPVHLLQIWIQPRSRGLEPSYQEVDFPDEDLADRMRLIASADGRDGSLTIHQDAEIRAGRLSAGTELEVDLGPDRHGWVQVARGRLQVESDGATVDLVAGDGLAISDLRTFKLTALEPSEVLVFSLA